MVRRFFLRLRRVGLRGLGGGDAGGWEVLVWKESGEPGVDSAGAGSASWDGGDGL